MSPGVHPVAGGFSSAVGHYSRSRPTYARGAIGAVKEAVGSAGPVADLAAGTGILTGQLHRAGLAMVAVEPLAPMLAQLRRSLPAVPAARAVAEHLPFAPGSLAAATVGQGFHWFDAPASLAAVAESLAEGGVLALLWNVRDESVAWVKELTDLVHRRSGGRPYDDHRERSWAEVVADSGRFTPLREVRFDNPVQSSPELLAERVRSTSFVAVMDPVAREGLLAEVAELVDSTPVLAGRRRFEYPHETVVHLCRRLP